MEASPELVCVGHVVQEMIHFVDRVRGPVLGSPPAYCSVAAARQGTPTGIVTKIGPDFPPDLLRPFRDAGVNTTGLQTGQRSTTSQLIYDAQGNKEIRYPTRADPITAADIPSGYRGCKILYVCTMDGDVPAEHLADVAASGQESAVDLGGYGGVHMSRANRQAAGSLATLACAVSAHFDIVKASDEDAVAIFGWDRPEDAARHLLGCGPQVVVITLGAKGSLVHTAKGRWLVPSLPCKLADTTGGGDTFMAGFLSEYLRSADPCRAARWGSATAAFVIEQSGGVRLERMPTRRQVQERMDSILQSTKEGGRECKV